MENKRSYAAAASKNVEGQVEREPQPIYSLPKGQGKRPRTILCKTKNYDITNRVLLQIIAKLGLAVQCVQKTQIGNHLVTLKRSADRENLLQQGYIMWDEEKIVLEDPNNGVAYVLVQYAPFELREEFFRKRLSRYGIVLNSRRNKIPETEVYNGLITVRMILKQHIPSFIQVGGYSVMCRYPGQPRTCRRCDSIDHVAAECNVYRCFNCSEPGHSSSACQEPSKCFLCDSEEHRMTNCYLWEGESADEEYDEREMEDAEEGISERAEEPKESTSQETKLDDPDDSSQYESESEGAQPMTEDSSSQEAESEGSISSTRSKRRLSESSGSETVKSVGKKKTSGTKKTTVSEKKEKSKANKSKKSRAEVCPSTLDNGSK